MQKISFLLVLMSFFTIQAQANIKYVVKNGDTLFSIAQRNHTSVEKLLKLNGLGKHQVLKAGKVLRVVHHSVRSSKGNRYAKRRKAISNTFLSAMEKQNIYIYRSGKYKKPNMEIDKKDLKNHIIEIAKTKLGRRYVWGAVGQRGTFDCSGFTSYVYKKKGIHIPRTSLRQSRYGKYIARRSLQKGDLIFFDTSRRRKGYVNHVGIYLGDGKFIHASSAKKRVVVSKLNKFYAQRYVGARRPS